MGPARLLLPMSNGHSRIAIAKPPTVCKRRKGQGNSPFVVCEQCVVLPNKRQQWTITNSQNFTLWALALFVITITTSQNILWDCVGYSMYYDKINMKYAYQWEDSARSDLKFIHFSLLFIKQCNVLFYEGARTRDVAAMHKRRDNFRTIISRRPTEKCIRSAIQNIAVIYKIMESRALCTSNSATLECSILFFFRAHPMEMTI